MCRIGTPARFKIRLRVRRFLPLRILKIFSFADAGFSCRYPPGADFLVGGVADRLARLGREVIVAEVSGPVPQDPPQLGIVGLRE